MKKILILCVSLKDSKARQDNITHQIQSLKQVVSDIQIDFQFFEAIYGKNFHLNIFPLLICVVNFQACVIML